MQSSNKTFYFSVIVILIIAMLVVTWKLLLPDYFQDKSNLKVANSEIQQERDKLDSVEKAKADLASVGDVVDKVFMAIPKDEDSPNLLSEIESIAVKNGLVVPSISIVSNPTALTDESGNPVSDAESSATASLITKVRVTLSVAGNFDQLSAFLASIEKSVKYMQVVSFNITSTADQLSLSLQIDALSRVGAPATAPLQ